MNILAKLGYIGLFLGTFLSASAISLPLSSDILLISAFASGGNYSDGGKLAWMYILLWYGLLL